jgi:hypothetical protein
MDKEKYPYLADFLKKQPPSKEEKPTATPKDAPFDDEWEEPDDELSKAIRNYYGG